MKTVKTMLALYVGLFGSISAGHAALLPCPNDNPLSTCAEDACSNDRLGIFGDECIAYDAPLYELPLYYVVSYRIGTSEPVECGFTEPNQTSALLTGTDCLSPNEEVAVVVKACPASGGDCGPYGTPVFFTPYVCINQIECFYDPDHPANSYCTECEARCSPSSSYHAPWIPDKCES